jgi:YVTN family beta-propeller protein
MLWIKIFLHSKQHRRIKMTQPKYYLIFLLCFILFSCISQGISSRYKAPLAEEGEVLIYLQPLPQEADRFSFVIDRIMVVAADGREFPVSLSFNDIKGSELMGVQRLLASVILPPGDYTGLSIHIAKAFLRTAEGDVALFVPDEPVTAVQGVSVARREVSTLFLSFSVAGTKLKGVKFTPVFSLAPSGGVLINLIGYVTNSASNYITVFDKKTMQVVNAVATGQAPKGIVLDQIRTRAYVAASRDSIIEVFDVFKGVLLNRLRLKLRDWPTDLALTPDGRTLVAVNSGSNTVSIIDALSMFETARVSVGEGPSSVAIDPSGSRAFVMNNRSSTISVVDLTQKGVSLTIGVEGAPLRAAFNKQGSQMFVINSNTPNLTVVDLSRLVVSQSVFIGMGAASIRVDDQTGLIYVGKTLGGEITVIDPFSLVFIDTIPVGGEAVFMTIDGQERNLFALLPDKKVLKKINLVSKKISAQIDVGDAGYAVVVMGER